MNNPIPPKWPGNLLRYICKDHLTEEIEGDLAEYYADWVKANGQTQADRTYIWHAMKFVRPYALKRPQIISETNYITMLGNHFKLAKRQIVNGKGYSLLNVLSLALGLVAFIMISLWISHERSIDTFHSNQSRLYSLYYTADGADNTLGGYPIPFEYVSPQWDMKDALSVEIKSSIPGVALATEYHPLYELPWGYPHTFQLGDQLHKLEGSMVNADFLQMFSFDIIAGEKNNPLKTANQIAISKRMASLFFEDTESAIGKTLRYENATNLVVSAVFDDVDHRSSMQFDYLLSWELNKLGKVRRASNQWVTYLLLEENANPDNVELLLKDLLKERLTENGEIDVTLGMLPLDKKQLFSEFENGVPTGGKIEYIRTFSWVGLFILVLACINFTGLATARSIKRAREIGVRKVMGSSKSALITQFLIESTLLSFLAMILAISMVWLSIPALNSALGLQLSVPIYSPEAWLSSIAITLSIGVFAGAYPAIFLSSLNINRVMKRDFKFSPATIWFQKGLVIFQSAISVTMLLVTLVAYQQTAYVKNSHLGYDRENVMYVTIEGDLIDKYLLFKNELINMPGIAMVDRASEAPHAMNFEIAEAIDWQGKESVSKVGFFPTSVGFEFLDLMNLEVINGRGFSRSIPSDTTAFMINEMAVQQMGITEPIGKWISAWNKKGKIIGVLKDYHINSLHMPIRPLIMDVKEGLEFGKILIKTLPGQTVTAIESIETIANRLNPNYPVEYEFMDVEYANLYQQEEVASSLANIFTVISLFICCLGLFGLAMTSAEQRTKEIGIRKVLGASLLNIVKTFSSSFIFLVCTAILLATPIAWVLLQDWLGDYAYHIELSWYYFAAAALFTLVLTMLSISVQTVQTALMNPVDTLKSE
ncbi:MAG: permease prefix domain 2-containing transporter [Cyclobacteriaceae bacterium]